MAENLVGAKIGGGSYNIWDWAVIGLSKRTTEAVLAKTPVGNGSYKSAILKAIGAYALSEGAKSTNGMATKGMNYVAAGMMVDAVEDATVAMLGAGNPIDAIGARLGGQQVGAQQSMEVI